MFSTFINFFVAPISLLAVLIFIHELGHFLLAKFFRVGVLDFSIGFGTVLWQRRFGETTYRLRLIPLGGFVKMVGEDPRLSGAAPAVETTVEPVAAAPEVQRMIVDESRWLLRQPYRAKFWIVFAGPLFNLIYAVVASFLLFYFFGMKDATFDTKPLIGEVHEGYAAAKAGLKVGDFVKTINGVTVVDWNQLRSTVLASGGKTLQFGIERPTVAVNQETGFPLAENAPTTQLTIPVTPTSDFGEIEYLTSGDTATKFGIGIGAPRTYKIIQVTLTEAAINSVLHTWDVAHMTLRGLFGMITGQVSSQHLGGPITVFRQTAERAQQGFEAFVGLSIFLSISLALLNLFPVPILDGGHIVFFTIEAILGKPMSIRLQEVAQAFGLVVLVALMIFAFYNDVGRLIG